MTSGNKIGKKYSFSKHLLFYMEKTDTKRAAATSDIISGNKR